MDRQVTLPVALEAPGILKVLVAEVLAMDPLAVDLLETDLLGMVALVDKETLR